MDDITLFWVALIGMLEVGGAAIGMLVLVYLLIELTK